jgi:hypothetical protein
MKLLHGMLGLSAICVVIVAISVAGAVFDFTSHLGLDMDGILLLLTCLTMGGLFALMLLLVAKEQGWLPSRKKESAATSAAPAAAKPPANPPAAGEGK